ncbi:MAG: aspartyl protease family protein [Alphaproteobacteria bacterium]|nr:aspartyl protease family protein [Alphaproteobacteria bacterium]MBU1526443.1 aspartyl protease family protein [Alphaproteobacteria bacterium]MBU2116975.1 aspartyl protease family protein [Alphaproteobacteria bacterium]MBU2352236.1 aspartyl protease family protein [Alphaproteobacteria bacterium]MBU2381711.1 aspartyl protease family protein [Alphaproteobacteria bacterium]
MVAAHRRAVLGGLAAVVAGPVLAQDAQDRVGRSTVPVRLNGQDLVFAVDTAATASVIASDLVGPLDLAPAGSAVMHTIVGAEAVALVTARSLASGALARTGVRLAVGDRRGLIGLDGLLGLDLLAGQRIDLRLRGRRGTSIGRSRLDDDTFLQAQRPRVSFSPPPAPAGAPARGLITLQMVVRGRPATGVVDTGAAVSLINPALAEAAQARPLALRGAADGQAVQSPTGASVAALPMSVNAVRMGGMLMDRLGVLMGDFHIFRHLGLADAPAMLVGVDVLGVFGRVIIDLDRGELILEI